MKIKQFGVISFVVFIIVLVSPIFTSAAAKLDSSDQSCLYRVTFVRAAPGKLLDLIDLFKDRMPVYDSMGDSRPFWWRHTQGDQWDLMMLFPMGSYTEYYSLERANRRTGAENKADLSAEEFKDKFREFSSWHEDIFVIGPSLKIVEESFENTGYYHVEIFVALPGKYKELFKEREMENLYAVGIGRPENLIFTRDKGAAWDMFTLGCYRDLKHWASSSDIPNEKKEAAAIKAGFKSGSEIGPYMRTLIVMHRDTMGVAIK
ncbi:hypothetical protein ACFLT9_08120 [Acidobacteriota bacterium]